jgi:hypothetical protein
LALSETSFVQTGGFTSRTITVDDTIGDGWIDTDGAGTGDEGIFRTYSGATYLFGWSRDSFLLNGAMARARIGFSELEGNDQLSIPSGYDVETTSSGTLVGAFLFRETRPVVEPPLPTGTVPVPSTLAILGLGLVGLMRTRFVKAK